MTTSNCPEYNGEGYIYDPTRPVVFPCTTTTRVTLNCGELENSFDDHDDVFAQCTHHVMLDPAWPCIWLDFNPKMNQCVDRPESCTACNDSADPDECCTIMNDLATCSDPDLVGCLECLFLDGSCLDRPTDLSELCDFCSKYPVDSTFLGTADCCTSILNFSGVSDPYSDLSCQFDEMTIRGEIYDAGAFAQEMTCYYESSHTTTSTSTSVIWPYGYDPCNGWGFLNECCVAVPDMTHYPVPAPKVKDISDCHDDDYDFCQECELLLEGDEPVLANDDSFIAVRLCCLNFNNRYVTLEHDGVNALGAPVAWNSDTEMRQCYFDPGFALTMGSDEEPNYGRPRCRRVEYTPDPDDTKFEGFCDYLDGIIKSRYPDWMSCANQNYTLIYLYIGMDDPEVHIGEYDYSHSQQNRMSTEQYGGPCVIDTRQMPFKVVSRYEPYESCSELVDHENSPTEWFRNVHDTTFTSQFCLRTSPVKYDTVHHETNSTDFFRTGMTGCYFNRHTDNCEEIPEACSQVRKERECSDLSNAGSNCQWEDGVGCTGTHNRLCQSTKFGPSYNEIEPHETSNLRAYMRCCDYVCQPDGEECQPFTVANYFDQRKFHINGIYLNGCYPVTALSPYEEIPCWRNKKCCDQWARYSWDMFYYWDSSSMGCLEIDGCSACNGLLAGAETESCCKALALNRQYQSEATGSAGGPCVYIDPICVDVDEYSDISCEMCEDIQDEVMRTNCCTIMADGCELSEDLYCSRMDPIVALPCSSCNDSDVVAERLTCCSNIQNDSFCIWNNVDRLCDSIVISCDHCAGSKICCDINESCLFIEGVGCQWYPDICENCDSVDNPELCCHQMRSGQCVFTYDEKCLSSNGILWNFSSPGVCSACLDDVECCHNLEECTMLGMSAGTPYCTESIELCSDCYSMNDLKECCLDNTDFCEFTEDSGSLLTGDNNLFRGTCSNRYTSCKSCNELPGLLVEQCCDMLGACRLDSESDCSLVEADTCLQCNSFPPQDIGDCCGSRDDLDCYLDDNTCLPRDDEIDCALCLTIECCHSDERCSWNYLQSSCININFLSCEDVNLINDRRKPECEAIGGCSWIWDTDIGGYCEIEIDPTTQFACIGINSTVNPSRTCLAAETCALVNGYCVSGGTDEEVSRQFCPEKVPLERRPLLVAMISSIVMLVLSIACFLSTQRCCDRRPPKRQKKGEAKDDDQRSMYEALQNEPVSDSAESESGEQPRAEKLGSSSPALISDWRYAGSQDGTNEESRIDAIFGKPESLLPPPSGL
eukprot:GHVH01001010.1.p1 GENE.GHVH01001010.1~~GHVH01001010.1.p1  ORF type:complete len:1273 (+),score=124.44 GHVH01001010.1:157-3975(+)